MNKANENNKLVPELRFLEFGKDGEWVEKRLGEVTRKVGKKNKESKKLPIYSINNKEGFLPQADQFDGVDSNSRGYDISLYKIVERNTFAYNPARIDVGSLGYSGELHNIIISSLYVCFKTNESVDDLFLLHFLNTNYFNQAVKNSTEGGIRHYLFYQNFSSIAFWLPPTKAEQQKIAATLTSLDNLIAAENEKLEALQAHKKGLLQQLFPEKGEKVPKLRFPEFETDGEWRLEAIDNLSETVTAGGTPSTKKEDYWGGNIRWMNSGELNLKIVREVEGRITDKGLKNSSTKIIPENCVLIGLAGQGKTRGTVAINKVELCTNQSIASIFPNDEVFDSSYLYHNLDNRYNELRELSAGGQGRGGLNLKIIKEIKIPIPPEKTEQQKIAATLTSLDNLIAAENEKLEALQAHKKGLLQQLFPNVNTKKS